MIWSFVADFSALIAFRPLGLQQLMEAVQTGSLSVTLVNLHIAIIRFIQSEAEIANAIGSVHVRPQYSTAVFVTFFPLFGLQHVANVSMGRHMENIPKRAW